MNKLTIAIGSIILLVMGMGVRHAKAEPSADGCMKARAILLQDVELTAEQKALLQDFKAQKSGKKDRHQMHKKMKEQHQSWMVEYISGDIDRDELLKEMEQRTAKQEEFRSQKQEMMLDLLATYDDAQKAQVLENLDSQQSCFEDKKSKMTEKHQKHKGKEKGKLVANLNLDSSQQQLWSAVQADRKAKWESVQDHEPGESLRAYLEGESTLADLEQEHQNRMDDKQDFHRSHVIKMMDFMDSLDQEQRSQLLHNIEVAKSRHQDKKHERGQGHER